MGDTGQEAISARIGVIIAGHGNGLAGHGKTRVPSGMWTERALSVVGDLTVLYITWKMIAKKEEKGLRMTEQGSRQDESNVSARCSLTNLPCKEQNKVTSFHPETAKC